MKGFLRDMLSVFQDIRRDSGVTSLLLIAVLFYSFFYPAAYQSQRAARLPIAVVDMDGSYYSRHVIRAVSTLQATHIRGNLSSLAEAEHWVNRGEVDGILFIPRGFAQDIYAQRGTNLMIYGNNAFIVRNSTVLKGLASIVADEVEKLVRQNLYRLGAGVTAERIIRSAQPVNLVARPLFNTREGYGSYVVVGVGQLLVQQTLLFGVVALLGRRNYLARHVLKKPEARRMSGRLFCASAVVFFVIGWANVLYFNGFVFWFQDYPRGGNILGMLVFSFVFVLAVVMLALFIASFFDRSYRALQVLGVTSMPVFFLSGLPWPGYAIPTFLHGIAQLLPTTSGINGFIRLNQMGASLTEVGMELLTLMALIVLFGGAAWWRWGATEGSPQLKSHTLLDV